MRADQLLMLGVVGLGGYAAYKMVSASPSPSGTDPVLPPGSPPSPGALPSGMVVLGNPLHLKEGQFYAGRLNLPSDPTGGVLPGSLNPFTQQASSEAIRAALEALGFNSVVIYSNIAQTVPQKENFPAETLMNPHAGTRWFIGRWGKPTMDVPRPPVIEQMWVTRTPSFLPVISGDGGVGPWLETSGGKLAAGAGLAVGAFLLSSAYPDHRGIFLGGAALGLGALYLSMPHPAPKPAG